MSWQKDLESTPLEVDLITKSIEVDTPTGPDGKRTIVTCLVCGDWNWDRIKGEEHVQCLIAFWLHELAARP